MLIQNAEEISDREVDRSGLLVCGTVIIQERASLHDPTPLTLYAGRWTGGTVDWWDGGLVGRGIGGTGDLWTYLRALCPTCTFTTFFANVFEK